MNKKDFKQWSPAAKKNSHGRAPMRWLVVGVCALVLAGGGLYGYLHRETVLPILSSSVDHFNVWVAEHKTHLNKKLVKVKNIATAKNEEQPIHFEFYSALPNMQVQSPMTTATTMPVVEKAPLKKSTHQAKRIVEASDVERELEKQFKR